MKKLSVLLFILLTMSMTIGMVYASAPTVTIDQDFSQRDPINAELIKFRAVFNQRVTDFTASDVIVGGTAPGTKTVNVNEVYPNDGTTFDVIVTGMTASGTVIVSIPANSAKNVAGEFNVTSSSTDNVVTYDIDRPSLTIIKAAEAPYNQKSPTNHTPLYWKLVFSEPVRSYNWSVFYSPPAQKDYDSDKECEWYFLDRAFDLTGTAVPSNWIYDDAGVWGWNNDRTCPDKGILNGPYIELQGSGSSYVVTVPGMPWSGTAKLTIKEGYFADDAGNWNTVSFGTDDTIVTDYMDPTVTINQAADQSDPTNDSVIKFTARFIEPIAGFTKDDIVVTGTAFSNPSNANVAIEEINPSDGTTFNVYVSGMDNLSGTVLARIPSAVVRDLADNPNSASASNDNNVFWYAGPSTVVSRNDDQNDPTNYSTIKFKVVFSTAVTGFDNTKVIVGGTAGNALTVGTVTGSGTTYVVPVNGMTKNGIVTLKVPGGVAGNNVPSNTCVITYDNVPPTAVVSKASWQQTPTSNSPIDFTVVFSEPVKGFDTSSSGVMLGGSATPTVKDVAEASPFDGTTYTISVRGMVTSGQVTVELTAGAAQDFAGNNSIASNVAGVTYDDANKLTVAVNQAASQPDPTSGAPINYTVTFSEDVTGFTASDVQVTGTAPGTKVATLTGSGSTFNVAVTGMTDSGTVIVNIPEGVCTSVSKGLSNVASFSNDNSVTYDVTKPSVTINQSANQDDPTNGTTINYTAVFSEPVYGFTNGGIILTGTAGADSVTVTDSGDHMTFAIAVTGMKNAGTVIAIIPASVCQDAVGNGNKASTSSDNSVTYEPRPLVTVEQSTSQFDPATSAPIKFTIIFSKPVNDFDETDITILGTSGGQKSVTVTNSGDGMNYIANVSGMTSAGTVIASVLAGVAHDANGYPNAASTSVDNTVTYSPPPPSVTINQASDQADPATGSTVKFTAVFSDVVTGFGDKQTDVTISGTASATTFTVTDSGDHKTYDVLISGMSSDGTVTASIPANAALGVGGTGNAKSTSTDNTVTWKSSGPGVTINQAASQNDPTSASPILFTVVFSKPVTGFTSSGISIGGTAGGSLTAAVTQVAPNDGTTYQVAVSGMTSSGTVTASVLANAAKDAGDNGNTASTSTDNQVTYSTSLIVVIKQAAGETTPTNISPLNFTITFSEPVTGFTVDDVVVTNGTKGALGGSGVNYTIAVTPTADGNVSVKVPKNSVTGSNGGNADSNTLVVVSDRTAPADFTPVADPSGCTDADLITVMFQSSDALSGLDHYEIALDTGAYTTQTSPYAFTATGLTEGSYTLHIKAIDKAGNSRIKDVPICISKPQAANFEDFRIVRLNDDSSESGITSTALGDKLLVKGKLKLAFSASAGTPPPVNGEIAILVEKPDGNNISVFASVSGFTLSGDGTSWLGDISVDYSTGEPKGDITIAEGDSIKATTTGNWQVSASWPGYSTWSETTSDIVNITVGGPMRTVAVKDPVIPDTSEPIIDMITPPMFVGLPTKADVGVVFGYDKAADMNIIRWDAPSKSYIQYKIGSSFAVAPGEALWIKPKASFAAEAIIQQDIDLGRVVSGNAGYSLDISNDYRLIKVTAKDYPIVTTSKGVAVIDPNTGRAQIKTCVIRLSEGWNMIGNIFFNWKKDISGKEILPREDVGLPVSEMKVRYLGVEKTIAEAAAAGWVRDYLWRYDASNNKYALVHESAAGAEREFKAWSGYWLKALVGCDLIVDPNTLYNGE